VVEQLVGGELDPTGHELLGADALVLLAQRIDGLEQAERGELWSVEPVAEIDARTGTASHGGDDAGSVACYAGWQLRDLDVHLRMLLREGLPDVRLHTGVRGPDAPHPHGVRIAIGSGGAVRAAHDRATGDGDCGAGAQSA